MSEIREPGVEQSTSMSPAVKATILAAVLAAVGVALAPVAYMFSGGIGLAACGVAWGICFACGMSALLICLALRDPKMMLYQALFGMALRMGIPLAICMAIYYQDGPLVEAGIVYYFLAFYMVNLLVDTALIVNPRKRASSGQA